MQRNTLIVAGIALVAVAIGIFAFLGSHQSEPAIPSQPSVVAVPFTTLVQGIQTGVLERVNYQITSPDELSSLWETIKATTTPPAVDFKKEQVLVVFAGNEPHTSIAVAKVEDSTVRMVSIALTKPDGTCKEKPSSVVPFSVVTVPNSLLPLTHTDIVVTTSCKN